MSKLKRKEEKTELQKHIEYVDFLKKRVFSLNFKNNSSVEEYKKTLDKYDKAKLKLKFMQK
jgi:hypothetical protein